MKGNVNAIININYNYYYYFERFSEDCNIDVELYSLSSKESLTD